MRVGNIENAAAISPFVDPLLQLLQAANAAYKIDAPVAPGIGNAEQRRQQAIGQQADIEPLDGIIDWYKRGMDVQPDTTEPTDRARIRPASPASLHQEWHAARSSGRFSTGIPAG